MGVCLLEATPVSQSLRPIRISRLCRRCALRRSLPAAENRFLSRPSRATCLYPRFGSCAACLRSCGRIDGSRIRDPQGGGISCVARFARPFCLHPSLCGWKWPNRAPPDESDAGLEADMTGRSFAWIGARPTWLRWKGLWFTETFPTSPALLLRKWRNSQDTSQATLNGFRVIG